MLAFMLNEKVRSGRNLGALGVDGTPKPEPRGGGPACLGTDCVDDISL